MSNKRPLHLCPGSGGVTSARVFEERQNLRPLGFSYFPSCTAIQRAFVYYSWTKTLLGFRDKMARNFRCYRRRILYAKKGTDGSVCLSTCPAQTTEFKFDCVHEGGVRHIVVPPRAQKGLDPDMMAMSAQPVYRLG